MRDVPKRVDILEEGPREGFQSEPASIAVGDKVKLIEALAETGLPEINCASFVNPRVVPQMAVAEDIAAAIKKRPGVRYTCMWLNESGYLRARGSGLSLSAVLSGSASDTFLMKNNRRAPSEYLDEQRKMRQLYTADDLGSGPIYIFTAFGCNYEGDVPVAKVLKCVADLVEICQENSTPPTYVYLCDTIGAADPTQVRRVVGAVRDRWPLLKVALHLHDTRGLGIANAQAGLEMGVDRFDASCGGLGGCPFAGNTAAAGNIATEELALLCDRMGVETGVDLKRLIEAAHLAEHIVGHSLPSKLAKAGVFNRGSAAA
jgi:hydroxymethylglutaryl-CoA lyase